MLMTLLTIFKSPPPFEVWHSHAKEKPRVLVTAGVDGDEYAGIEAAKQLINNYKITPPKVPITIIPIVNLAGYHAKTSQNPLDNRYPKHIYPGSHFGTSSSKLMWQLSKYVEGVELWLDLHGGAGDEHLNPFVWADKTGNPKVDTLTISLLSKLHARTVYSQNTLKPSAILGRRNTSYLILESGEMDKTTKVAVDNHLTWVTTCLTNLDSPTSTPFTPTYNSVVYHKGSTYKEENLLWSSPTYFVTGS